MALFNVMPRTLLVAQVIFGRPLRNHRLFHAGQVDQLVARHIGVGNAAKVIARLLEEGWIEGRPAPRNAPRPPTGRPPVYYYTRTSKGQREFTALADDLADYGIVLAR